MKIIAKSPIIKKLLSTLILAVIVEIITKPLIASTGGAISFAFGFLQSKWNIYWLIISLLLTAVFMLLLIFVFCRRITGLVGIYRNYDKIEENIISKTRESNKVFIFLQIGRSFIMKSDGLSNALRMNKSATIQILHAKLDGRYLNLRYALERDPQGNKYEDWVNYLNFITKDLKRLPHIDARAHNEGFLWTLFIFDDVAYVQPYLYKSKNREKAPIFKFSKIIKGKENEKSLYKIFSEYFAHKWGENLPKSFLIGRIINNKSMVSITTIMRYRNSYIFVIPRRYINDDGTVYFHGIGGKTRSHKEDYTKALKREIYEEVGLSNTKILSSKETFLIIGSNGAEEVQIEDNKKPKYIYQRKRDNDGIIGSGKDVDWILSYETNISDLEFDSLVPKNEIAAILGITPNLLVRIGTTRNITFGEIKNNKNAISKLAEDVEIDDNSILIPTGIATLLLTDLYKKHTHNG